MSMEVKDRVITVLFSSAAERRTQCVDISSSGVLVPQVIAWHRKLSLCSRYSMTCNTSEVWPEREIHTGWQGTGSNCGKIRMSDAGIARAFSPVKMVQLAAALCAK